MSFYEKLSAKLQKLTSKPQEDRADTPESEHPPAAEPEPEPEIAPVPIGGVQVPFNSPSNSGVYQKDVVQAAVRGDEKVSVAEVGSVAFDISKIGPSDIAFDRLDEAGVAKWLSDNKFTSETRKKLEDNTGQDLLDLSRDDVVQLVGSKEGIRLYNRLKIFKKA